MMSIATVTTTKSVKADTIFVSTDETSISSIAAVSDSLELLSTTMNQTVSAVSKAKENQSIPASAKEQSDADKLVNTAKKYIGVPYVWGGTTPAGFDCSGFTSYVYRNALGKEIGRTTWNQISNGKKVPLNQAKIGDLIIFYGGSHVGLYLGNGQIIHAPEPGQSIKISSISEMSADYALQF